LKIFIIFLKHSGIVEILAGFNSKSYELFLSETFSDVRVYSNLRNLIIQNHFFKIADKSYPLLTPKNWLQRRVRATLYQETSCSFTQDKHASENPVSFCRTHYPPYSD
jgi:hypothetical protein